MQIEKTNTDITSTESVFDKTSIEALDNTSELLKNGIAIYTSSPELNRNEILKTYPDGRQEVVCMNDSYKEVVLRAI
jgi:hypothetical protein